jgi:predicted transcriptional regulator
MVAQTKSEKVTITIPSELKEQLNSLKDELNVSVSFIYKEALEAYLESKEMKRWEVGAALAFKDDNYIKFVEEISQDFGDIYEY